MKFLKSQVLLSVFKAKLLSATFQGLIQVPHMDIPSGATLYEFIFDPLPLTLRSKHDEAWRV